MRIVAAILAAGSGERFGGDKTSVLLGGKPLWRWSFDAYRFHPRVSDVILVASEGNFAELSRAGRTILGGSTRQESSRLALEAAGDADVLLVHDAARPFVSHGVISAVIDGIARSGAAACGVPVTDTVRDRTTGSLDRTRLVAMQTPQGATTELLRRAHALGAQGTDEMSIIEAAGGTPEIVPGERRNMKITDPDDLIAARGIAQVGEVRTGLGYDVHRFATDGRPCVLGGVLFEGAPGLEGHSDADALLHAITDSLLGAAALGDIGVHFPNTDPRWRGEPSTTFLRHAAQLARDQGWEIVNVDASVIAETPKIMGRAAEIRANVADAVGIDVGRVSVKATTNEGLGAIGRSEGVAAFATTTLQHL